jgi:hypothetical protein
MISTKWMASTAFQKLNVLPTTTRTLTLKHAQVHAQLLNTPCSKQNLVVTVVIATNMLELAWSAKILQILLLPL